MRLVLLSAVDTAQVTLEGMRAAGAAAIDGICPSASNGATLSPSTSGACYNLVFDQNEWQSLFTVAPSGSEAISFFAQHLPTNFEAGSHYFKDINGTDIEPGGELTLGLLGGVDVPWGTGIGAAVTVNLLTFSGIVFLAPGLAAIVRKNGRLFEAAVSAFAAGALLAAALFLLLFEGVHLVGTLDAGEGAHTFRWGVIIMTGFVTSFVIDTIVQLFITGEVEAPATATRTAVDAEANRGEIQVAEIKLSTASYSARARVLGGILIGDFMHNFCDGIFMGTAFLHCSDSLAWSIATATILHEIAQELADYLVLTNPMQGGLKPAVALAVNFFSGTSVVLGTIVIFAIENLDDYATGMLLAYGGGVYVQIGATECMPRVFEACRTFRDRVLCLGMFCVGALAIGLVLLDHQHCSAGGQAGHGH